MTWGVLLLSALFSWLICLLLVRAGGRFIDYPNERSLHRQPVPKGGGLGILSGTILVFVLVPLPPGVVLVVVSAVFLGVFSLFDDLFHLSPSIRFVVQGGLAGLVVGQGLWPAQWPFPGGASWPSIAGIAFGWLFLVWMTNLYNFMDGMDGFAGGMTVVGFGTMAALGWLAGDVEFALISGAVASAAAAFLWFNLPPARLFMGDVGSAALGFLAAGLMLWADRAGLFPLWVGALVFSTFIVDATVTLMRRLLRGEKVWRPHRSHYYQRLVQMGWGHRKTVLREYLIMLACAGSALIALRLPSWGAWCVLVGWGGVYAWIIYWVGKNTVRVFGQPE